MAVARPKGFEIDQYSFNWYFACFQAYKNSYQDILNIHHCISSKKVDILACFKAYENFYHPIFNIHLSMSSEKGWDFAKWPL